MNAPLPVEVACKTCQIAADDGMHGAYDLFGCLDCRVRYALDCIDRLSPSKHEADRAKDRLFEELLKWRKQ